MEKKDVCKFFMNGNCKKGDKCDFIHDWNFCRDIFFKGECFRENCRFNHRPKVENIRKKKPRRPKNTETFEPSHKPPDMRVIVENGGSKYPREHRSNDIILVNNLFCEKDDMTIYNNLLKEIKETKIDEHTLWKLWHGDTHLIADDKLGWKRDCPTFKMVIDKVKDYFEVDVKATRFNLYEDSSQWKPFHHDAAAVKPDKAKTQNITIGISFGLEREAAFEHAKTKTTISLPLPNGSIYVFNRDVNVEWKHGILQMNPDKMIEEGRISIIAWGWVEMKDK